MIHVNGFLCHHVATKTEGDCDEIGHATFSDATFSEMRRFRTKQKNTLPLAAASMALWLDEVLSFYMPLEGYRIFAGMIRSSNLSCTRLF